MHVIEQILKQYVLRNLCISYCNNFVLIHLYGLTLDDLVRYFLLSEKFLILGQYQIFVWWKFVPKSFPHFAVASNICNLPINIALTQIIVFVSLAFYLFKNTKFNNISICHFHNYPDQIKHFFSTYFTYLTCVRASYSTYLKHIYICISYMHICELSASCLFRRNPKLLRLFFLHCGRSRTEISLLLFHPEEVFVYVHVRYVTSFLLTKRQQVLVQGNIWYLPRYLFIYFEKSSSEFRNASLLYRAFKSVKLKKEYI